ncbi:hypothetical protein V1478_018433 [Vespula squamosa]|uniref:Uncharacterized protein n=1 Tax=Vespula squamosa TaxID=30214 RepID=A0ABD1ZV05_VESSQ
MSTVTRQNACRVILDNAHVDRYSTKCMSSVTRQISIMCNLLSNEFHAQTISLYNKSVLLMQDAWIFLSWLIGWLVGWMNSLGKAMRSECVRMKTQEFHSLGDPKYFIRSDNHRLLIDHKLHRPLRLKSIVITHFADRKYNITLLSKPLLANGISMFTNTRNDQSLTKRSIRISSIQLPTVPLIYRSRFYKLKNFTVEIVVSNVTLGYVGKIRTIKALEDIRIQNSITLSVSSSSNSRSSLIASTNDELYSIFFHWKISMLIDLMIVMKRMSRTITREKEKIDSISNKERKGKIKIFIYFHVKDFDTFY